MPTETLIASTIRPFAVIRSEVTYFDLTDADLPEGFDPEFPDTWPDFFTAHNPGAAVHYECVERPF